MFTQSQFFKALSLSAFYFIAQTALAIAPHKTGLTDSVGAPYADGWDAYTIGLVCAAPVAIFYGWKMLLGLIKLNSDQKKYTL